MKQLSCIGHVDNLRAQIRHDLRELGIKVPKPKKSKRGGPKLQQVIEKTHHTHTLKLVNKRQLIGVYLVATCLECQLVRMVVYIDR